MTDELMKAVRRTKYPLDAFIFVQRGLDHTVRGIHGELEEDDFDEMQDRHVSGTQLCLGLRSFAVQQYGLLARTVLRRWNISSCEDFGHIVFAMVEAGQMYKTDEDTLDDFVGVYDFAEAFECDLSLAENA
jgi:uncharacterized repeat protein (TIGR04138 family)